MSSNLFMRLTAAAAEDARRSEHYQSLHIQRQADKPLADAARKMSELVREYVGSVDRFKNVFEPLDITDDPEGRAVALMATMSTLGDEIPHGPMARYGYSVVNLSEKVAAFRDWVAARPEIKPEQPFLPRLDAVIAEANGLDFFKKITEPAIHLGRGKAHG